MKVVHVITGFNRGGAENHLLELATGMHKAGVEVSVVVLMNLLGLKPKLEAEGVRVVSLWVKRYFSLFGFLKLLRLINKESPDIIHAHLPPAELMVYLCSFFWKTKTKFILSKHLDGYFIDSLRLNVDYLVRKICKRADYTICISQAVRTRFKDIGVSDAKLKLVYYGMSPLGFVKKDNDTTKNARMKLNLPNDALIFGTVCRFELQKNLNRLIDAFSMFKKTINKNSYLVLIGDGTQKDNLVKLVEEQNLNKNVIFTGRRIDIPEIMCALDVFCLVSLYEGFGLVLLESMATGLPIIASNISAIPEVVIDGQTAILVEPTDVDSISSAMEKLTDTDLRMNYGAAGFERLVSNFKPIEMIEKTISIYNSMITDI